MADTGNNRKIVNFTYSCLYTRPIKVVSVDNIISNHFYYFILKIYTNYKLPAFRTNFIKLRFWKLLSNSSATFNLENVSLLSNPNFNSKNGVAYKKTCSSLVLLKCRPHLKTSSFCPKICFGSIYGFSKSLISFNKLASKGTPIRGNFSYVGIICLKVGGVKGGLKGWKRFFIIVCFAKASLIMVCDLQPLADIPNTACFGDTFPCYIFWLFMIS